MCTRVAFHDGRENHTTRAQLPILTSSPRQAHEQREARLLGQLNGNLPTEANEAPPQTNEACTRRLVTPAKAGVQGPKCLHSGLRRNDGAELPA